MSKKQTVFRVAKNRDNPYVMLNKLFLEHPKLSFRAKGILAYLLSKPDHWKLAVSDLMNHGKEGRDAIYAALKNLIENGFLQHVCYRHKGKISHYEYIVYEQPLATPIETTVYHTYSESEILLPENSDTAITDADEVLSAPQLTENPEVEQPLVPPEKMVLPGKPDSENPTLVINNSSNKLINKACSSRARCTIFDLWQEIFQHELSEQEYRALLKISSRTSVVKELCLIHEHHHVASILNPFSFVMACIANGGYRVHSKVSQSHTFSCAKKHTSPPLPKAVQAQLEGRYLEPKISPEELAEKRRIIDEKIRMLYENEPRREWEK